MRAAATRKRKKLEMRCYNVGASASVTLALRMCLHRVSNTIKCNKKNRYSTLIELNKNKIVESNE